MDTIRLTGSYVLAPARLANSAVWYALGYSTTLDSSTAPASTTASARGPGQPPEHAHAQPSTCSDGGADDARVVRALRAAMREWSDASSSLSSVGDEKDEEEDDGDADEPQLDERARDHEPPQLPRSPADIPLPASPSASSSLDDADDALPATPSSPHPPSSPPALVPLPRPLSSLSRLSRRATLCLSHVVDLNSLDFSLDTPRPAAEEGGEPSKRDKELVERVMAAEVERVTEEVEGFVDEALREQDNEAFERVDVEGGAVETDAFLRAAESLVSMTELLAPAAASLCAGEFLADLGRVRARRQLFPTRTVTLEQLVQSERRERRLPATDALEWLVLIIGFMVESFRRNLSQQPPEELSTSISTVWDRGFAKHFNWLVRPLFKVVLRACPSRAHVYSKLALSPSTTLVDVERDLGAWLDRVEVVLARVREMLEREERRR
ncbi:hypothetical protein JCM3775_001998 [Rhodotorula graminis]